eukprot:1431348-Lingulodinium_polyedra.AAC.1
MPVSCRGARSQKGAKKAHVWRGGARWQKARTGMNGPQRPGTPSRSSRTPPTPWTPQHWRVAWQISG